MAINFPTSLDTLTNPTSTDTLDSPSHSQQHSDANDAIEALQVKVGIDASTPTANTVLGGDGAGNSSWRTVKTEDIDSSDKSGADATLVTGTKGTTDQIAIWNSDGDAVGADFTDGAKFDGDKLDIDFTPTNYTPDSSPTEADDVDDLSAHLKGVDSALATAGLGTKQTLSFGGDHVTANVGRHSLANGEANSTAQVAGHQTRAPVTQAGTINRVSVYHEGDLSSNNATWKILVNGTVQATLTSTGGAGSVDLFTSVGVSVSAGDYVEFEYDAGSDSPGNTITLITVD